MRGNTARRGSRLLERALVIIGVVCLGYYAHQTIEAQNFQREQAAAFEAALAANAVEVSASAGATSHASKPSSASPGVASAPSASVTARRALPTDEQPKASRAAMVEHRGSEVMALLDIPRLKLSSAVLSGDDPDVLDVAIGHLADTPRPWEGGNSALAAHRDGLFRPLRNIRVGDELRVRSQHGELVYRVRETKIVAPDDLSVLAPTETPSLTLITCYPFNFIGSAPKRFIVHADRVDSALSTQ